jgi:diguanylate cyclase (GGDEF)-like protein
LQTGGRSLCVTGSIAAALMRFSIPIAVLRNGGSTFVFVGLALALILSGFAHLHAGWYPADALLLLAVTALLVGLVRKMRELRTELAVAREAVKQARQREHHMAQDRLRSRRYDELTGLANRAQIEERLADAAASAQFGGILGILFLTLDRFSDVNDRFGRGAADVILAKVASRLAAAVAPNATVARYSGDEFVVLAPVSAAESVAQLGETLRQTINAPIDGPDGTVRITASIGMALFPCDGTSAESLLERADDAARHAKRAGGNRASSYSRDLSEQSRERRRLQEELSAALLRDEFVLHYQPIVDLRTGKVVKAEALIRWRHPTRGTLGPGTFIPVAEQSNLMELLGYWVIDEVVRQAAVWDAKGLAIRIAVNVSAKQIDDAGFVPHLTEALRRANVPPNRLELEITETAAMTDASAAQDVLERCRALGLSVSLDDFGTYYSSLAYLKRLPIDNVKIDKSFVQGIPFVKSDTAIVSGILGLARALERIVIAEGIENESQRDWLVRAGCEFGQGFLFGRPMPAAEIYRRYFGADGAADENAVAR